MKSIVLSSLLLSSGFCSAAALSYTGTLTSPIDSFMLTVNLAANGSITLQTYGFGGGTNAAGTFVSPGGFDSFVGLFAGTGPAALFLGGTADNLSNYTNGGCGPAGFLTIGKATGQCGDVNLQFNGLTAGAYTVVLSDASYVPNAVYETTGYLGDGFSDLTGGSFPLQTYYDSSNCNVDTANWALDVTTPGSATASTPEPASLAMAALGLTLVVTASLRKPVA